MAKHPWGPGANPMAALARHLRHEHGWGIRRIAKTLNASELWVKDAVDFGGPSG